MSLTTHNYSFTSEESMFFEQNTKIFSCLKNAIIKQVYAVWDCIDNVWFDNAPMLIVTSAVILSVKMKSDIDIAIGWNDISLSERPRWFSEEQESEIKGLNWYEDLEWKKYDKAGIQQLYNEEIEEILFHAYDNNWGVGIGLKCKSGKCLWIYDSGDVIAGKIDNYKKK